MDSRIRRKHPSHCTNILGGIEEHLASWTKVLGGGMTDQKNGTVGITRTHTVLRLCRKVLLRRTGAVDLLQDVLGATPFQHQDGQVPFVCLVDHLTREGMADVRR